MIKQHTAPQPEALCRQYCRQVKHCLSCPASIQKPILSQLEESVLFYLEEQPSANLQELCSHFGTPEDFAANVLENLDGKQLQTQLRRYRWRKIILVAIFGLALGYVIFYCARLAINHIFHPGYVIIGEAQEYEGPIPTSPPIP